MSNSKPRNVMDDFRQEVIRERQEMENEIISEIQSRQQRRAQERKSLKELDIQNRFLFLKAQNEKLMRERLEKIKVRQGKENE